MKDFVDGLILSGAHLRARATQKSASLWLRDENSNYLEWVRQQLKAIGIETSSFVCLEDGSFRLITRFSPNLYPFYLKWYKKGKKRLPHDFELSPIVALIWFLRGGHIEKINRSRYTPAIRLWIFRFPRTDREQILREFAAKIGIHVSLYEGKQYAMLRIGVKDVPKFLKYIGECPKELEATFGEKWQILKRGK